ncbi:MAG: DNA adenine methylase [Nitrospirota bacterium]
MTNMIYSPLRYPGGKAVLSKFLSEVIAVNDLQEVTYVEPYAGGAGAALALLFGEFVQRIILNDADPCVFAFWQAILHRKNDFLSRLENTPVNIDQWKRQRDIYLNQSRHSRIQVAFASFFLNRCNRSGIMVNGGPIGGYEQCGPWKIDARYNKRELIRRIEKIYLYRDRIGFHNMDAISFLRKVIRENNKYSNTFVYLDPPYYVKGRELYLNHYGPSDHVRLAEFIRKKDKLNWVITYDDVPEIRKLYSDCRRTPFHLNYSAHKRKKGSELLIYRKGFRIPALDMVAENP